MADCVTPDPFSDDVLERLIKSNQDYQRTHGHYIVALSERLLAARRELEDEKAMSCSLAPLSDGQTWRHKRDRFREVTVRRVTDPFSDGIRRVYVDRNTSRRTQAIKETTLRREYEATS